MDYIVNEEGAHHGDDVLAEEAKGAHAQALFVVLPLDAPLLGARVALVHDFAKELGIVQNNTHQTHPTTEVGHPQSGEHFWHQKQKGYELE